MIPVAEPFLGKEELNNVIDAVKSGWISSRGNYIPRFESEFAAYCGTRYGVATANGTVALHLSLAALEIGEGDEVIVPTLTFIATANAVRYTGAKPVFVDAHPNYWCLDPERIEAAITARTKAIIPVHLYGHPCDMNKIMTIAEKHKLLIIEDAAEAHGAEYQNKKVGSFGTVGCFSFFGNKIITTGEGGMCLTDNKELANKMSLLRDHGMNPNKKYWHDVTGFNYRMTNIQAAIGTAQFQKIDEFLSKKRQIVSWYAENLKNVQGISLQPQLDWAKCVCWMYSVLIEDDFGMSRDSVIEYMAKEGIETRPLFYPLTTMPPYKDNYCYPVAVSYLEKE